MPEPSFVVCIDESGDQGLKFNTAGSTKWFVLSAVVGLHGRAEDMHGLVKRIKSEIDWRKQQALHFKKVKADKRQRVIQGLVDGRDLFRAISVLVHKPSLTDPEAFSEKNRLYLYYTRYLLERVSWLCRDCREGREKRHGDGTARIIFSCMNEVSKARLEEYLQQLQEMDTAIEWGVLRKDQIETLSPGKHAGLQIADAVAGAFYCTDHHCEKHKTDGWAEMLKPVMF